MWGLACDIEMLGLVLVAIVAKYLALRDFPGEALH
jgi:hypothetical protein